MGLPNFKGRKSGLPGFESYWKPCSTDLPCLTSVLAGDTLDSQNSSYMYCKFENFRENFIFANGVKRHICDVKNLRQRQDLPISVNHRVISPFHEGFFHETSHMRSFNKIKPSQKYPN